MFDDLIQVYGFEEHLNLMSTKFIYSTIAPSPELQILTSNFLPDILTWISTRHLKFSMSQTELLIFSKHDSSKIFAISAYGNFNFLDQKPWSHT